MAARGAESSRSGSMTADSYLGSLISLTSKSEIRYEGILNNINTEESSIGLRNVRSFGTEGRKKDGPQIPPSDKVYEFILFRGSDIKDLQVKSSPSIQPASHIHNDPAIIQSKSNYPPPSTSASLPAVTAEPVGDMSSHAGQSQVEYPRPPLQGGLPLYQPGGSLASWGSSPPTANGSGLGMPMYWQGFYPPSGGMPGGLPGGMPGGLPGGMPGGLPGGMPGGLPGGISHLQPPPLLRPPPGLSMPYSMQQPFQYPGINASLPSVPQNISGSNTSLPFGSLNFQGSSESLPVSSTLSEIPPYLPPISGSLSLSSVSSASTMAPIVQANTLISNMPQNKNAVPTLPLATSVSKLDSVSINSKTRILPGSHLVYQAISQPAPSTIGLPNSSHVETSMPSLVNSGKLLQSQSSTFASTQSLQLSENIMVKDKMPNVQSAKTEPLKSSADEANQPILPLPTPLVRKPNGTAAHKNHIYRGRGRGRGNGNGYVRPVTKFEEDFDFIAMNEKFKKDQVWGDLGKSKGLSSDREGDVNENFNAGSDGVKDEDDACSKIETKPVYVKDDFFDTLSCNSLGTGNERTKYSEQMKLDTETFGEFPRHHPNRGGRGYRGGRTRGFYYGRGGGGGYGYPGRGRASNSFN
ncbi:Protein decapping 5 [Zostera marina]|uniref:Protein decapping 5 n=1 Tax=Zostera marina TaxID=29655 RepID=A0A0K9PVJ3_ZOSMR|nr:Protein decapping 5 [Zostera marina]